MLDAFKDATGRLLMQDQVERLSLVAFMSQALKPTEQWYSVYERELVVVAYCFIQWCHYLEDLPDGVMVIKDHQLLAFLIDQ